MRRFIGPAAAALAAALVAAAPAAASSIVYAKGGNVWIAAPDGSRQTQVTHDGTAGDPYYSPTQADDGTIVAVRGGQGEDGMLYRMDQSGRLLNQPFKTASPLGGVGGASVSPDGRTVAYWFATAVVPGYGNGLQASSATTYTAAAGFTPPGAAGLQREYEEPSWLSNGRTLLVDGNLIGYDDVGGGDGSATSWFTTYDFDPNANDSRDYHHAVVTRQGDKLAVVERSGDTSVPDHLALFTVPAGAPPAKPAPACQADPGGQIGALSWSPDGTQLAYSLADGIHIDGIPSLANCGALTTAGLVIPGGSDPSWGPADVGASAGTVPSGPGGTGPGGATKLAIGGHQSLGAVLRSGLRVTVRCPGACAVGAVAVIARRTAKRLHIRTAGGGKTVAVGQASARGAGAVSVRIRLSRAARRHLRGVRKLRLGVGAIVQTGAGTQKVAKIVTLRR